MDACAELVAVAHRLAGQTNEAREFLYRLGAEAAGIRRGVNGYLDIARGGSNPLRGGGFRARFDDDTEGQVRHFAGVATAAVRIGPGLARRLSIGVLRDGPSTADGRLSDAAVDFSRALLTGELAVSEAPGWIERRLCA